MNLDDCYSEKNRSASGDIVARTHFLPPWVGFDLFVRTGSIISDKTRFPSGMKFLTNKIHSLGM